MAGVRPDTCEEHDRKVLTARLAAQLVDALREAGALNQRELCQRLGATETDVRRVLGQLVKAGTVTRTVRKEYDKQRGHATAFFGGAGVMLRHRAYFNLTEGA